MNVEFAVVGAGASGLAAAATLRREGREVLVLEAADRVGGAAWSERRGEWLFERGANTFRAPAAFARFAREQGLEPALVPASPRSRERFLLRDGELVRVPLGPLDLVTTPLLSGAGKLRLLREPLVRRGDATGESVAEFVERRLGREVLDGLVGPFLTGVYAGDERALGAEAVFPSLVEAERRGGSITLGLLRGALAGRDPERGLAGTWSTVRGVAGVSEQLARPLREAIRCRNRVSGITFEEGFYRLEIEGNSEFGRVRARKLVLAVGGREGADLLGSLESAAAEELAAIDAAPVVSVSLGVDPAALRTRVRGFGYLVPRGEGDAVLGCLFPSQLFAGRAPAGRELLTVLAGGKRRPDFVDEPDDRVCQQVAEELDRVLGLRADPEWLGVSRWPRAVAQPGREHPRQVARVRSRLASFPGLALAGGHLDGVAFGEAVASGAEAARALLRPSTA